MASKEPIENPNTPNVNFIGFQKQLREIIKDIKQSNKKTGLKKIFGGKKQVNPHVDGRILENDAPNNKEVSKLIKQLDSDPTDPLFVCAWSML